jgi:hypothetical protein
MRRDIQEGQYPHVALPAYQRSDFVVLQAFRLSIVSDIDRTLHSNAMAPISFGVAIGQDSLPRSRAIVRELSPVIVRRIFRRTPLIVLVIHCESSLSRCNT